MLDICVFWGQSAKQQRCLNVMKILCQIDERQKEHPKIRSQIENLDARKRMKGVYMSYIQTIVTSVTS